MDLLQLTFIVLSLILLSFTLPWRYGQLWSQPTVQKSQEVNESTTTVIIGAGVAGLCTAYQLAKATNSTQHKIIVIDAADKVFAATSSTNTGILSYTRFNESLLPLAQYSYDLWEKLGENAEFRTSCGYRKDATFALKNNSSEGEREALPDWVHSRPEWYAIKDPPDSKTAIINPAALGKWLYMECLRYGVDIRLGTTIASKRVNITDTTLSLEVFHGNDEESVVLCSNLVLAAGPWSPALYTELFPKSSAKIRPVISAGEWFVFENPEPLTDKSIAAVYFDDIVGEKLEFAGRNDGNLWATSVKSKVGVVPPVGHTPEPDPDILAKLRRYADTFLKHPHKDGHKQPLRVVSQGRSYRPATWNSLPVIAEIPKCRLVSIDSFATKLKVYINTGHGSYGVTLGMGSGKVLSQMILDEPLDVNVSHMSPSYL